MSSFKALGSGGAFALLPDALVDGADVLEGVAIVVEGSRVAYVGPPDQIPEAFSGLSVQRLSGFTLMPGMIDAHHHIIEPFAKALTCGEPAQMWKRIWMPLEAVATEESCYRGAKWTFVEALRGGMTTIVDHAVRGEAFAAAVHAAADDVGIRLVSPVGGYDLKNFGSSSSPDANAGVDATLALARRHVDACSRHARIYPSVACGTVQSNSKEMIAALAAFSREADILFQIHANEHTGEVQSSIEAYGRRPIELLDEIGALGPTTLLAHATLVTPHEIRRLAETRTSVSYNPVASVWKGNNIAPALEYCERGVRLALGSDATRNDGFRMLESAEACQRIAYGIPNDDFSCGAGWRWLHAATAGGADAIGLGREIGRLAPGYAADFLVLRSNHPEVAPRWDLAWELVRFYDRADIAATFIDGRLVCEAGSPVAFDLDEFVASALPRGVEEIHAAKITRLHSTSGEHRRAHGR